MSPFNRRIAFAVFLALGAAGFGAFSLIPLPWGVLCDIALAVGLFFAGERLFWPEKGRVAVAPAGLVLTPALEVPVAFQSDPVAFQDDLAEEEEPAGDVGPEVGPLPPENADVQTQTAAVEALAEAQALIRELLPFLSELPKVLDQPSPLSGKLVEIQEGVDFVRENVVRGYEISDNLANSAKQAFDLSEKVQGGLRIVTGALSESLGQTKVLYEHSLRIAKILGLMSEVSDKIHILSINASIVSARAGVSGRGFEVVAKEIRALAKETELSLGEIEEVIGLLQTTIATVMRVVTDADKETEEETSSLISVAGSLQGVILGVEIVRAVSSFAKEKSEENSAFIARLIQEPAPGNGVQAQVAGWAKRLQDYLPKE
ncbi:MAG: methyl-accepting chemotaxis protein [Spirochaetales bacterium]